MTTVLDSLNGGLHQLMEVDPRVVILGEDILDPYGGAFKVTRGLSTRFPERVFTSPISEAEVAKIVNQMQEGTEKPRHKVEFVVGEYVRVKDGPFTDFNGSVEDVNYDKSKVRVAVTIFGRSTPVELDFSQIEKT